MLEDASIGGVGFGAEPAPEDISVLIKEWPPLELATALKVDRYRVYNWRRTGRIPPEYHHAVVVLSCARGKPITHEWLARQHSHYRRAPPGPYPKRRRSASVRLPPAASLPGVQSGDPG
jgi:hypothetical protein